MGTKICGKCGEEKILSEFYSGRSECKSCKKLSSLNNYKNNKPKYRETQKSYWEKNKEELLVKKNKYYHDNRKKCRKQQNEYRLKNLEEQRLRTSEWAKNNRDHINKYKKRIRDNNPIVKIKDNVRRRIDYFLKTNDTQKNNKTFDIVGCDPQFLKEYLENQFKEGMSWENYGLYGWHIDHKIPLSSAETENEIYKLCHYTNLQPLWAEENLSKGSKIN